MSKKQRKGRGIRSSRESGEERNHEEMLGAEKRSESPNEDIQRLTLELRACQDELRDRNEELRRAQTTVTEMENRYGEMWDLAPVGYFAVDEQGVITEVNQTGAQFLLMERGALERLRASECLRPLEARFVGSG